MIKALALAVSGVLVGSAALAGPYVNVENNAGYQDGYLGSTTDIHVGFEGSDAVYGYYLQAGPAVVAPADGSWPFASGSGWRIAAVPVGSAALADRSWLDRLENPPVANGDLFSLWCCEFRGIQRLQRLWIPARGCARAGSVGPRQ